MMADDSEPVVLETSSVHSIDTLYVAGYVAFAAPIKAKLAEADRLTGSSRDPVLTEFKRLFEESDPDAQRGVEVRRLVFILKILDHRS